MRFLSYLQANKLAGVIAVGRSEDSWVRDEGQFVIHSNSGGRVSVPIPSGLHKEGQVMPGTQWVAFQERNLNLGNLNLL